MAVDDVDLDRLLLRAPGLPPLDVRALITDGQVERTMEGASTVTVDLNDRDRKILNGGYLTNETDIRIDGLSFRLDGFEKTGDRLSLTFVDLPVAVLRTYPKPDAPQHGYKHWPASKTTRARLAKWLVEEPARHHELEIAFVCPALATPAQIKSSADRPTQDARDLERGFGFAPGAAVQVKGEPASKQQLANIDRVLQVGASMLVRRKLLVCAVMTITQESTATNLLGGDRDSVGLFQQRASQGWPASRDVETDAHAFYEHAIAVDRAQPNIAYEKLCSTVQRDYTFGTAFEGRDYARWRTEAEHTVTAWGIAGADTGSAAAAAKQNNQLPLASSDTAHQFTRGTVTVVNGKRVWKRENNWDCLGRLADEVGWRRFCVSGTVYFIADRDLFRSRPRMTVSEETPGVDAIDGVYKQRLKNSQLTVTCHVGLWQAPPGTLVAVEKQGPLSGRWLVASIRRPIFSSVAEITLKKPQPVLPEALSPELAVTGSGGGVTFTAPTGENGTPAQAQAIRSAIVAACKKVYDTRSDYRYRQTRPMPSSLFAPPFPVEIDCSSFATLAYKAAGAADPNGNGYNGAGNTSTLWENGAATKSLQLGDLVFYGSEPRLGGAPGHVAVYAGNGKVWSHGSPGGPRLLEVNYRSDLRGYRTYTLLSPAAADRQQRGSAQGGAAQ